MHLKTLAVVAASMCVMTSVAAAPLPADTNSTRQVGSLSSPAAGAKVPGRARTPVSQAKPHATDESLTISIHREERSRASLTSPPPEPYVLRFQKGQTRAVVEGGIVRGERQFITLHARRGQHLALEIDSVENNAVFDVFYPGAKFIAENEVDGAALAGRPWCECKSLAARLPVSGNYLIVVGATRANAGYWLKVSITDDAPRTPASVKPGSAARAAMHGDCVCTR